MAITYEFNGLVGCVIQSRSRQTGLVVGIYHNEQAGMDATGGPWSAVCERHNQITAHSTLALVRYHAVDPMTWCEVCNGNEAAEPEVNLTAHQVTRAAVQPALLPASLNTHRTRNHQQLRNS